MKSFREIAIESVFYSVVSPPIEFFGNKTPFSTVDAIHLDYLDIFVLSPLGLAYVRI